MKTHSSTEVLDVEASPFAAEDYVQMACQLRRSADMRVRYPDGKSGGIVVNKGELWHAWDNLGGGNEAFLRMVGTARVTRIRSLSPTDATTRTITESCQKLLLQALILRDAAGKNEVTQEPRSASTLSARASQVSDSELTRPNWPALRNGVIPLHEPDTEAITARSYTERPVEINAAPVPKPRGISTFLRTPSNVQRASAALLGGILLVSVSQIVASPSGASTRQAHAKPEAETIVQTHSGAPVSISRSNLPTPNTSTSRARNIASRAVEHGSNVGAQPPSEVVFNVSALPPVNWSGPMPVWTRVHNVSSSGEVNNEALSRHVITATAQFASCYDAAPVRSFDQAGTGDVSVVVNIDNKGSVVSASSRGGKLQGLNTCVAELAERLGESLEPLNGPSRLAWTVSFQPQQASATHSVTGEIH